MHAVALRSRWGLALWIGLGIAAVGCKPKPRTIVIDQAELQAQVETKFPVQKEALLSTVTLEHPKVLLRAGSDRVGIDLGVRMKVPLLPEGSGGLAATGKLVYRAEKKAFYLQDCVIERLDVAGLEAEYASKVRGPVELVARSALELVPVYELQQRDLKEIAAEYVLQDVSVQDGKLLVRLAMPF